MGFDVLGWWPLSWARRSRVDLGVALLALWGCSGRLSSVGELGGGGSLGVAGAGTPPLPSFGGGVTDASAGTQAAGGAGSSGQTQAGGGANSEPMSSLFKPCTTTAGDWCQKVVSGQTISPYLITLNSHDHLILAGQSSGGGLVLAEYTPNGQTVWVHELAAGVVDSAQGLTTDVNDNIFISGGLYGGLTGLGHPLIAKLTPEGQLLWSRDPGGLFGTAGLAADANGNAVLVTGSNEVLKYSPSGDLLWRLTPKDKTGVSQPSVDAAGNILALTTDASSAFLTEWSASGEPISDEKLYPVSGSPPSLAFDRNGDLLFVGYDGVTVRPLLWRFSRATGVVWTTKLTDRLLTADQIALDARGRIYIVGMASDSSKPSYDSYLAQYDPDGELLWGQASGERGGAAARSLVVSRDGKAYITGGTASGAFVMGVSPP